MVFSRQEYWSWLPRLLQGIFPTQGLNPCLLQAGRYFTAEPLGKLPVLSYVLSIMKTKSWFSKLVSSLLKSLDSLQRLSESHSVMSDSLRVHGLYSPWNSPGQNTAVGSLSLLQETFWIQGSNPGLSHCRWILYQLSHKRSPRILEWVAYPFSSGSSHPGIKPGSPALQVDSLLTGKPKCLLKMIVKE